MSPTPRPRTSSRAASSRPRRLAGQAGTAGPATAEPDLAVPEVDETQVAEPGVRETPADETPADETPADETPADEPTPEVAESAPGRPSLFEGARVTVALLVAVVVLTAATLGMAGYLWLSDDEPAPAAAVPEGEIAVPEGRPILIPWADAQAAAAAAAEAAAAAVSTSWKTYDEQLDEALATMTPSFAEEFRTTKEDARAGVVENKIDVTARVVAQSVVRANTTEVQALLFLDQYTTTDGEGTTVSPYRVLATVVNTDGGWLVADLETR
jgi:Mce-associated membrane protein